MIQLSDELLSLVVLELVALTVDLKSQLRISIQALWHAVLPTFMINKAIFQSAQRALSSRFLDLAVAGDEGPWPRDMAWSSNKTIQWLRRYVCPQITTKISITALRALEDCELDRAQIDMEIFVIQALSHLPRVASLNLANFDGPTLEPLLQTLQIRASALVSLQLSDLTLSCISLPHPIGQIPTLRSLTLVNFQFGTERVFFKDLPTINQVVHLKLHGARTTGSAAFVKAFARLISLELNLCNHYTMDIFRMVKLPITLQELRFGFDFGCGTSLTDSYHWRSEPVAFFQSASKALRAQALPKLETIYFYEGDRKPEARGETHSAARRMFAELSQVKSLHIWLASYFSVAVDALSDTFPRGLQSLQDLELVVPEANEHMSRGLRLSLSDVIREMRVRKFECVCIRRGGQHRSARWIMNRPLRPLLGFTNTRQETPVAIAVAGRARPLTNNSVLPFEAGPQCFCARSPLQLSAHYRW